MSLEWMPRNNEVKDHALHRNPHWGTEAPCVMYEKKPLTDPNGKKTEKIVCCLDHPEQSQTIQLLYHGHGKGRDCRV